MAAMLEAGGGPDARNDVAATQTRRRTKIIATLGPASHEEGVIGRLVEAGMDVARINLSHGSTAEHAASIAAARRAASLCGAPLAILIDLPGPKLRLSDLPRPLEVKAGEVVVLGAPPARLPVNFPELLGHFAPGELVLIDDGAVALRVSAVTPPTVALEVLNDGVIESRKGVNLPDTHLPISALTAADRELLAWGLRQDVDFVALSFVRSAADVRELKELIAAAGGDQLVVAKIEKKEALAVHEEIIAAADAVMVARGDLGRGDRPGDGADLAEAHHPRGQRRRQAGDHGDADAAVDGRLPAADARRGKRRRQRHLRRDQRRHALGRDRHRLPTRLRRCARWPRSRRS